MLILLIAIHPQINSFISLLLLVSFSIKTQAIWFGSKSDLTKLSTANISVYVGSAISQPSAVVHDLGLHLDSELSMKHHVAKVAAVCFYHMRRLRQIRRSVGTEVQVTILLVLAVVISRLDYCNSVLAGVPLATFGPLQPVQNAAALLIFELTPRDHITPSLLQRHWRSTLMH